jgi:hypothetical protein
VYPDAWSIPYEKWPAFIWSFLYERTQIARQVGKPLILEEFGCCAFEQYNQNRMNIFQQIITASNSYQLAGYLFWQLFPNGSPLVMDSRYDLTPSADILSILQIQK